MAYDFFKLYKDINIIIIIMERDEAECTMTHFSPFASAWFSKANFTVKSPEKGVRRPMHPAQQNMGNIVHCVGGLFVW